MERVRRWLRLVALCGSLIVLYFAVPATPHLGPQDAVARGLITPNQVAAVNAEVERQLGPFGTWQICPHQDSDACPCRKPLPGLIIQGARALHVMPAECLVIGDRYTDLDAAAAAGAKGIFVSQWLRTQPRHTGAAPPSVRVRGRSG